MIPSLPSVTLLAIDCTPKVALAERAIEKSLEQCAFGAVKLLTDDRTRKFAVEIPKIETIEDYSRFCIQDLHRYVDTHHCLLIQSDGYVLNGAGWQPAFLRYDYVGSPWHHCKMTGNGGFSLRSKRLLEALAKNPFGDNPHPEDQYISIRHREELEKRFRIRYPSYQMASMFSYEGRNWVQGKEWIGSQTAWGGQFGFHSWLTPLPTDIDRPTIFHHSGDFGDVIYSLATIKAMGGGVLFLSPENRYPFPSSTRMRPSQQWADNIAGLINCQDYIWRCEFNHQMPYSVDVDLNSFRQFYRTKNPDNWSSLFRLHLKAAKVDYPEDKAWLTVDYPITIPDRPIIVSRTARYQNERFPWQRLVRKYQDKMVFIGAMDEYAYFRQKYKATMPHIITPTLLDAARIVAGAKVVVGNQSCVMAIALGLNKPAITEVWQLNQNCKLNRSNQIHDIRGMIDIPGVWLS